MKENKVYRGRGEGDGSVGMGDGVGSFRFAIWVVMG